MNDILTWDFQGSEVRTVNIDSEPWWVLADVCNVLELARGTKVAERLDEDEVRRTSLTDTLGRTQDMCIVSESGLYSVILRSDKPKAKPFRRWVTHEVLPAIRESGMYSMLDEDSRPVKMTSSYEYLEIAKIISRCKTERLQLVIEVLNKGGYDIPDKQKMIAQGYLDTSLVSGMIKEAMVKYNLTLCKLAKELNFPSAMLSRYANEKSFPTDKTYRRFIESFEEFEERMKHGYHFY